MNKKIIAALCALTICLSAAACGQTDSAEDAPAETTAAQSAPAPVTMATEAVPTEPVDLSKGLTDAMYERAVVSEGNKARLAKAMKRLQRRGHHCGRYRRLHYSGKQCH